MAKLNDFLGGLMSSISDARVNSDIQSLKIAEEYSKNDLLKHFAVPRMRIDKVELNIPVAINKLVEKKETVFEPIDNVSFSSKAYQQILKALEVDKLPDEISKKIRTYIAQHVNLLEAKIRVNQTENALAEFSKSIALNVIDLSDTLFVDIKRKPLSKTQLSKLQADISSGLQMSLNNEIKIRFEANVFDNLQVIMEADKLREIKPENVIMIKMTISEQGMEWVKSENTSGEVTNKLMPE